MDVLKKVPVREQDAKVRAANFEEVCLGYNKEEAMEEAARCINCKNAQCIKGCPVSIDIPGFIYADDLGDYIAERGNLFFDMYKLPFPMALDHEKLIENIENFDTEAYRNQLQQFMKENGIFEDGKASKRVVKLIERRQKGNRRHMKT